MKKFIMGLLLAGSVFAVEPGLQEACKNFININKFCLIEPKRIGARCDAFVGAIEMQLKAALHHDSTLKSRPDFHKAEGYVNLILDNCRKSCRMSIDTFYKKEKKLYRECIRTRMWGYYGK